jgi:hypothetical protein
MAHTLGPWKVNEDYRADGSIKVYESLAVGGRRREGGALKVASVSNTRGNAMDNARLIATAPDLLAACQAALYLLGDDADRAAIGVKPWAPRGAESVPEILRAAIAKAEGREE